MAGSFRAERYTMLTFYRRDAFKQHLISPKLLIFFTISLISALIFFFVEDKMSYLNFFYLPTLYAAYYYQKRGGVITSLGCILFVLLIIYTTSDFFRVEPARTINTLVVWGSFLLISGYLVGRLTSKVNRIYLGVLTSLATALDSRDPYTEDHSQRVSEYAASMARVLGFPREYQEKVRIAGLLHDIGKIGILDEVLRKPGSLDNHEKEIIRKHPQIGTDILSPIMLLREVLPVILYHHEYQDGKGYYRLNREQIPFPASILAVADAWDAMTSARPYRSPLPLVEALRRLQQDKGSHFDPRAVDALVEVLEAENVTAPDSAP